MVWQWLNFSWTDALKKRACRALLNRYLGKYLDQKLELDGMTIDLANGCCKVENVRLSAEALNSSLESLQAPVEVESGVIKTVAISVPWMALIKDSCAVDIQGISLTVRFRPGTRATNGMSLTESFLVSTGQTSLDIASEVSSQEVNLEDNYGGVDALAGAIQHILDRLRVSITDISLVLRQPSQDHQRQFAVRVSLSRVEFFDTIRDQGLPPGQEREGEDETVLIRPFATKVLRLENPQLEFAETPLSSLDPAHSTLTWSLFAMATDKMEVKLKVKQQEEVSGHKVELEGYCGAMHLLLSPEQLHSLTEMFSAISSEVLSTRPHQPLSHEPGKSRPIRLQEYSQVQSQLEREMMANHRRQTEERLLREQDPFTHPLEPSHPLQSSLSDLSTEDTFYSIELSTSSPDDRDLPPLGIPPKLSLRSDPFHSMVLAVGSPGSDHAPYMSSITSTRTNVSKATTDWSEEESSVYRFVLNALTVTVLHSDQIGLIHQDGRGRGLSLDSRDELFQSLRPDQEGEESVGPAPSRQESIEGDEQLRSRYLKSLGEEYRKEGTTAERLGTAVPSDHLLVWLSTVRWEVEQAGPRVAIETSFSKACLLEHLFGHSPDSLTAVQTPLCCNQLLRLSSAVDPGSSLTFARPCFKMTYSSQPRPRKQSGRARGTVADAVELSIEVGGAEVELDPTLADRLDVLWSAARLSKPVSLDRPHNYTSLYLHRDSSHRIQQRREEVFQQNFTSASPTPLQWNVSCSSLNILVKFPVPNGLQTSTSNPWMQFQKMHNEKLLLRISKVAMETKPNSPSYEEQYSLTFDQLKGCLVHEGWPQGEEFLCVGGGEGQDQALPEVLIKRRPQTSGDLDTPTAGIGSTGDQSLGDSILLGIEKECSQEGSSPFSTERTTHISEETSDSDTLFGEKVLPGTDREMEVFRNAMAAKSLLHITAKLPYLMVNFPNKELFDLVHKRVSEDLLSWEPRRYSLESSILNSRSLYNPLAPPPLAPPPGDEFKPCFSMQQDETLEESTEGDFPASRRPSGDGLANQNEAYGPCKFTFHFLCDQAVVTIATCPTTPSTSPPEEESLIEVSPPPCPAPCCPESRPLEARAEGLDLFSCSYSAGAAQHMALQVQELTLGEVGGATFIRPSDHTHRLTQPKYRNFLTVAMETRPSQSLFQTSKWTLVLSQASLQHHVDSSWMGTVAAFFTPPPAPAPAPAPGPAPGPSLPKQPVSVSLLHLHLKDCCVQYQPLHLPLTAVLWMDDVSLSTSIVPGSTEFSLRLLVDTCCLYLSTEERISSLHDAVCVVEAGPLDLLLKSTAPDLNDTSTAPSNTSTAPSNTSTASSNTSTAPNDTTTAPNDTSSGSSSSCGGGPEDGGRLQVELSGGKVVLRTCADSCVALRDLVLYLASDGDLLAPAAPPPSDPPEAGLRAPPPPVSLEPPDLSSRLLEAIKDEEKPSPAVWHSQDGLATSSTVGKTELTDKGTCVMFDSDSESDSLGKISRPAVSPPALPSPSQASSQSFPDELEDNGFLVYEPSHCPSPKESPTTEQPVVRCLCEDTDALQLKDNYFTKPSGYVDRLQRPRHYPAPVRSFTLKQLDLLWVCYGGRDFGSYLRHSPSPTGSSHELSKAKKSPSSGKKRVKMAATRPDPRAREAGGVARDHDTQVEVSLSKVRTRYERFPWRARQSSRLVVVVQDVEVRDRLGLSEINKLLYQFTQEGLPRQTHANMLSFKLVFTRPGGGDPQEEGTARVSVLPVRVNLDQDTAYFLHNHFLDVSLAPPPACLAAGPPPAASPTGPPGAPVPGLYLKTFSFSPALPVRVDYVAKHIDIDKGSIAGLLAGMSHLNCLQITLKSLHSTRGFTSWSELGGFAVEQWQTDITTAQLPRMISGVGPLHYITQFVNGFVDLVWLPWEQYQEDGRILRGLQRGASSFTASSGAASLELSSRLVAGFESLVRLVSNATGGRTAEPRPPLHPQGFYEGFSTAYNVVTQGVSGTVTDAVQVVYSEHEDRGLMAALGGVVQVLPRMFFRPIIHVSEATRLALTGMRNELLPEARREEADKYRTDKT